MDEFLSNSRCVFWKGYCTTLLVNKKALLPDLWKAFHTLPHELLIAEFNAHRFRLKALKLMNHYLSQVNQRTKINESSSSWEQIIFGVLQGSVLGPVLFKIVLSDLFLILNDINKVSDSIDITLVT